MNSFAGAATAAGTVLLMLPVATESGEDTSLGFGIMTLASALALRERARRYELPEERPIVG